MRALRAGCRWWPRAWSSSSAAPGGSRKPLKEWELAVGPRGRLRVRLPCEVSVRPLEPRRSPGSERRLLVTVRGDRRDPERVRVRYDEELQLAAIAADGVGSGAAVEVRAPAEFGGCWVPLRGLWGSLRVGVAAWPFSGLKSSGRKAGQGFSYRQTTSGSHHSRWYHQAPAYKPFLGAAITAGNSRHLY